MNKSLHITTIVFAIAISSAAAKALATQASAERASAPIQAAAQQVPTPTQSAPNSPTQPATASPQTTQGNAPGSATDASGGGVAGAAGTANRKTQVPDTPETPGDAAQPAEGELQTQIQNALAKEPTLSGDTVNVTVTEQEIELSGSVGTAREKQTATRIVQSYAGNKKVVSHLTVSSRNRNVAPNGTTPKGH